MEVVGLHFDWVVFVLTTHQSPPFRSVLHNPANSLILLRRIGVVQQLLTKSSHSPDASGHTVTKEMVHRCN
jgi:hypothetical protein